MCALPTPELTENVGTAEQAAHTPKDCHAERQESWCTRGFYSVSGRLFAYWFRVELSPDLQEVDITLMSTHRKKLAGLQPDSELVPWKPEPPPHPHVASRC